MRTKLEQDCFMVDISDNFPGVINDDGPMSPQDEAMELYLDSGEVSALETANSELQKAQAAGDEEQVRYWKTVVACLLNLDEPTIRLVVES